MKSFIKVKMKFKSKLMIIITSYCFTEVDDTTLSFCLLVSKDIVYIYTTAPDFLAWLCFKMILFFMDSQLGREINSLKYSLLKWRQAQCPLWRQYQSVFYYLFQIVTLNEVWNW